MKTKFLKFALPIGMGLMLTAITIIGVVSVTFTSCTKEEEKETKHCTDPGYPYWCPSAKACCPAGYGYDCDGRCQTSPCPVGTVTASGCYRE
jgi:hypothetical protein